MLIKGRELQARERARDYFELCHIAFIPNTSKEGFEKLSDHYWHRSMSTIEIARLEWERKQLSELTKATTPVFDLVKPEHGQGVLDVFRGLGG